MAALEEPAAETLLEMTDLMADRRRRQVELGSRAGEAQMPRRRLEGAQRMQRRQTGHRLARLARRIAAAEHAAGTTRLRPPLSFSLRGRARGRAAGLLPVWGGDIISPGSGG